MYLYIKLFFTNTQEMVFVNTQKMIFANTRKMTFGALQSSATKKRIRAPAPRTTERQSQERGSVEAAGRNKQ